MFPIKGAVSLSAHLLCAYCFNFEICQKLSENIWCLQVASPSTEMIYSYKMIFKLVGLPNLKKSTRLFQVWRSKMFENHLTCITFVLNDAATTQKAFSDSLWYILKIQTICAERTRRRWHSFNVDEHLKHRNYPCAIKDYNSSDQCLLIITVHINEDKRGVNGETCINQYTPWKMSQWMTRVHSESKK